MFAEVWTGKWEVLWYWPRFNVNALQNVSFGVYHEPLTRDGNGTLTLFQRDSLPLLMSSIEIWSVCSSNHRRLTSMRLMKFSCGPGSEMNPLRSRVWIVSALVELRPWGDYVTSVCAADWCLPRWSRVLCFLSHLRHVLDGHLTTLCPGAIQLTHRLSFLACSRRSVGVCARLCKGYNLFLLLSWLSMRYEVFSEDLFHFRRQMVALCCLILLELGSAFPEKPKINRMITLVTAWGLEALDYYSCLQDRSMAYLFFSVARQIGFEVPQLLAPGDWLIVPQLPEKLVGLLPLQIVAVKSGQRHLGSFNIWTEVSATAGYSCSVHDVLYKVWSELPPLWWRTHRDCSRMSFDRRFGPEALDGFQPRLPKWLWVSL